MRPPRRYQLGGLLQMHWLWIVILVLFVLSLTGCESLHQMSDDWCAAHPQAPSYKCWGHEYISRGMTP